MTTTKQIIMDKLSAGIGLASVSESMQGGEFYGLYGSRDNEGTVFTYGNWYSLDGSTNVNHAIDASQLQDGTNIENIMDNDFFTADHPIRSSRQLASEVDDFIN